MWGFHTFLCHIWYKTECLLVLNSQVNETSYLNTSHRNENNCVALISWLLRGDLCGVHKCTNLHFLLYSISRSRFIFCKSGSVKLCGDKVCEGQRKTACWRRPDVSERDRYSNWRGSTVQHVSCRLTSLVSDADPVDGRADVACPQRLNGRLTSPLRLFLSRDCELSSSPEGCDFSSIASFRASPPT